MKEAKIGLAALSSALEAVHKRLGRCQDRRCRLASVRECHPSSGCSHSLMTVASTPWNRTGTTSACSNRMAISEVSDLSLSRSTFGARSVRRRRDRSRGTRSGSRGCVFDAEASCALASSAVRLGRRCERARPRLTSRWVDDLRPPRHRGTKRVIVPLFLEHTQDVSVV